MYIHNALVHRVVSIHVHVHVHAHYCMYNYTHASASSPFFEKWLTVLVLSFSLHCLEMVHVTCICIQLCHSAMLLGQAYIQARDQVVGKKGSQLWSPALTYTSDDLQRGLASRLTPSAGEEAVEETRVKGEREGGTSGGKTDTSDLSLTVPSSAEPIDQLTVSDRTYRVGDTVYLSARWWCVRVCAVHDVHVTVT